MPRIKEILLVEPDFSVVVRWSTGEIRRIALRRQLEACATQPASVCKPLLDFERFRQVKTDSYTLYWPNGLRLRETDGSFSDAPLDFCPDVLYGLSVAVEPSRL